MRTSAELREGFLSFFESKGHARVPSASLIPRADDHSTLFTSAGMQPQMPFFLGREPPPAPLTTTAQKCLRAVDIDSVGLDTYHLTFFEMLGNFSFGQYFKEGAIEYATEFLLEHLKLDWDRLWATVHAGDPELRLGPDEVAIELWERIGMPPERIVQLPTSENFWSVGGPGPCGPDSEIYYDWGAEAGCGEPDCLPGCTRCERFLEFWNLVFMEYELQPDGILVPLPTQNIDTGLGLERTARIVQNVPSAYDTDGYQRIMGWIADRSGVAYGDSPEATKAHRILADHGRGMTFIAAEGVAPSNEGRGYVLRRIIRRSVLQATRIGLESPFLAGLADAVAEQMGEAYRELAEHRDEIRRVLTAEEERFGETLARGLRVFEEVAQGEVISGEDAFKLHDTYGFPLELTRELAIERGLTVDEEGFEALMAEQRQRSRAVAAQVVGDIGGPPTEFVGYEKTEVLTAISALQEVEPGLFRAKLFESPFYVEGGGQVTDQGFIEHQATGARAVLRSGERIGDDQVLTFEGESFAVGDRVRAVVPWSVRFPTMANHTATHLLHRALQEVLGDHVRQAGSAVRPDKLRFDFTHPRELSGQERAEVQRRVNEKVFQNHPVRAFVTPIEEARKLGAMMLFGEKYGDEVRVVEVDGYSRELCGGTHVRSTAEIGPFAILSERSVGAGARRIEAVTSGEAYAYLQAQAHEADELRAELERVRKEPRRPKAKQTAEFEPIYDEALDGVNVVIGTVQSEDANALMEVADRLKQQRAPAAVVLGSAEAGKVSLVAMIDPSLAGRLSAVDWVRAAATPVGGGGGGRPTMARAGGKDPDKLPEALDSAREWIRATLE